MTYLINKSNGELLATIADGTIDTTSTSITLVGRDAINFGQSVNTNFVKLLESSANTSPPEYPLMGQLWYDSATGKLKVYDGSAFKLSGGAVVSPIAPSAPMIGDFWIDNSANQLFFWDGAEMVLVGPGYTSIQGKTGIFSQDIIDNQSRSQTVSTIIIGGITVGMFSKSTFTPYLPVSGFSGSIKSGFTLSTLINGNLNSNSESASALKLSDGTVKSAETVVFADSDNIIDGSLVIQNDAGVTIGANDNLIFSINSNNSVITNTLQDTKLSIRVNKTAGLVVTTMDAVTIDSNIKAIGLFNESPMTTVDVGGDVTIRGNLYVRGAGMPMILSMDVTGQPDANQYVLDQLGILAPSSIFGNGTVARVHCTTGGTPINKVFEIVDAMWTYTSDL